MLDVLPKVSVVIPAYNAMRYLPETIDSVLKQTFTDFELIVINDGSSDNIIEWFSEVNDPRFRLISQENQGMANARNTGILQARGEYIAFLDADDLWKETKLEKQVLCLNENPSVGLVYTWTEFINSNGERTKFTVAHTSKGNIWEQIIVEDVVGSGSSAMVRACCFDKVGLFDPSVAIAADFDMWVRIAYVYEITVVKEFLLLYRQHENNASKNRLEMINIHAQVIEKNFRGVPLDSFYLRNRAYGNLYRYQSWLAVQDGNYKEAIYLLNQAILHYPTLRYSINCIRLSFAILVSCHLGAGIYNKLHQYTRSLRHLLSIFFRISNTLV
jgi:glycosyltransferase involved in cell wall biosynthesis